LIERAQTVDGSSSINNSSSSNDRARRRKCSDSEDDALEGDDRSSDDDDDDDDDYDDDEQDWTGVQAVTRRKNGDPESLYFFKWHNETSGTWETASSWLDHPDLDLGKGMTEEQVRDRIRELEDAAECEFAVEDVTRRRVVRGGRGGDQVQYLFKWVNEDRQTWESSLSWTGNYGQLTFKTGMSKEQVLDRFKELDKAAENNQKKRKKAKK
jgi:hypothetical protein